MKSGRNAKGGTAATDTQIADAAAERAATPLRFNFKLKPDWGFAMPRHLFETDDGSSNAGSGSARANSPMACLRSDANLHHEIGERRTTKAADCRISTDRS